MLTPYEIDVNIFTQHPFKTYRAYNYTDPQRKVAMELIWTSDVNCEV